MLFSDAQPVPARTGRAHGLPLRLALLAVGLLLAALLPLATFGQDASGQTAGPPPGSRVPLAVGGQPVGHLTVGDILTFVRADDDQSATLAADKLVMLELAVTNVTAEPMRFDPGAVALLDDAGASYRTLPDLQITASDDDGLFGDDDIPAGTTERGWLGYAIPVERAPAAAVFEDDDDSTPAFPLADLTVAQASAGDDDDGIGDDDDGIAGNESGFGDDDDGRGDDDDGIIGNEAGLGDDDDGRGDDDDGIAGNEGRDDDDGFGDDDDGIAGNQDGGPGGFGDDDDGLGDDDDGVAGNEAGFGDDDDGLGDDDDGYAANEGLYGDDGRGDDDDGVAGNAGAGTGGGGYVGGGDDDDGGGWVGGGGDDDDGGGDGDD